MAIFARDKADRVAAIVGGAGFLAGIVLMAVGSLVPSGEVPVTSSTTVVSTAVPGDPVTQTVISTEPPVRASATPRVSQEVTVTDGGGPSSVTVTTAPAVATQPFLGSTVATVVVQLILVTFASLLLAFATHRVLLAEYGFRVRPATIPGGSIEVDEAVAVKQDVVAATEAPDLSRPLFERAGVTDARLRLLQSRIALELEVRKLAQDNDLPSGLSVPFVVKGLVEKGRMSDRLGSAVTALNGMGDRLGSGAELSPDASTLLTESFAQALAKVGGKIKEPTGKK